MACSRPTVPAPVQAMSMSAIFVGPRVPFWRSPPVMPREVDVDDVISSSGPGKGYSYSIYNRSSFL